MKEEIVSFTQNTQGDPPFYVQMSGISYCDGSYRIDRFKSEIYCFEYIISGRGTILVSGEKLTPSEGDIYMLHRGEDHIYYSDGEKPWIKIWFNIRGAVIDNLISAYGLDKTYLINGLNIKALFYKFYETCVLEKDCPERAFISASLIFHEILINIHAHLNLNIPKGNESALRLKSYLDSHLDSNVTIEELSTLIYRSPSQTIRIFKKEFDMTPYDYFLSKKLQTAKLLLTNTNMSIKEISIYLKFVDEHYFSNYFKQHTGIAPKHYRNNRNKNNL